MNKTPETTFNAINSRGFKMKHTEGSGARNPSRWKRGAVIWLAGALAFTAAGCTTVNGSAGGGSNAGAGASKGSIAIGPNPAADGAIKKIVNGRTISIGFAPPILSEWYQEVQKSAWNTMKDYSDRYGVKWVWERQGANDSHSGSSITDTIQGFVARRVNAMWVCSAAKPTTNQALYKMAANKGIDTYQFNEPVEITNPSLATGPTAGLSNVSNIGYDNRWQSGYVAGQYIAKTLHGKGTVIAITGPAGSDWTTLRIQGFHQAISAYPDMKIVGEADGGYVRDQGLTAAQSLLTKNPHVDAIYGENEDMALGASSAVSAAGLKLWNGNSGIVVIGADGLVSGMKAIQAGTLTATVDVNAVEIGRQLVETTFGHEVLGQSVPEFIDVPTTVVDKSNVDWSLANLQGTMNGPGKY